MLERCPEIIFDTPRFNVYYAGKDQAVIKPISETGLNRMGHSVSRTLLFLSGRDPAYEDMSAMRRAFRHASRLSARDYRTDAQDGVDAAETA